MKTLAIRLEDDVHAQLSVLAQLEELTITDAIREAIEEFIETRRYRPELTARADAALADIERDATTRREAIAALLDQGPQLALPDSTETSPEGDKRPLGFKPPSRSSRTRGGDSATS